MKVDRRAIIFLASACVSGAVWLGIAGSVFNWYPGLTADSKAIFWPNVAVAVGTLALAAVTSLSILQTKAMFAGEERRHQQQFSPLVIASFDQTSARLTYANIGTGLAVDLRAEISATVSYVGTVEQEMGTEEFEAACKKYKGLAYKASDISGNVIAFIPQEMTSTVNLSKVISALAMSSDESAYVAPYGNNRYSSPTFCINSAILSYSDVFGNRYFTAYPEGQLDVYEWIRPKALKFQAFSDQT